MTQELLSHTGVVRYDIDISSLALGQYYIKLMTEDGFTRATTFVKTSN